MALGLMGILPDEQQRLLGLGTPWPNPAVLPHTRHSHAHLWHKGLLKTHLRCHPMADVHDGDILCIWPLIKTQISLQGILQLNIRGNVATPKGKDGRKHNY